MAGYKLVELVKKQGVYTTDNQVANAIGVSRANISNWKNRENNRPDGESALLLADLAKLTPIEAYEIMKNGYIELSLLIMTMCGSLAFVFADVKWLILYIMSNSNASGQTHKDRIYA